MGADDWLLGDTYSTVMVVVVVRCSQVGEHFAATSGCVGWDHLGCLLPPEMLGIVWRSLIWEVPKFPKFPKFPS